jgi:hypothetical protein
MMFCSQCGKSNISNAHFCTQCGNTLTLTDSVPVVDTVIEGIDSAPISPARNYLSTPPGVAGWSWGAFIFGWFWAVCNKTWIGLLALVPGVGFIMHFVLGFKGREWAWKNDEWESVEHFQRVQRRWSQVAIGLILFFILMFYGMMYFLGSTMDLPSSSNSALKV